MESRNGEVPSPLQVVTNLNGSSARADANSLTGADDGTIQHVSREREGRKSHDGRGDIEYPHGHFQSRT